MRCHTFAHPNFMAAIFNKRSLTDNPRPLTSYLPSARKDKVCLVKAASSANHQGFRKIVRPQYGDYYSNEPDVLADGVILTEPGSCAIIRTGDCPAVVLFEQKTKRLVFLHAGRPALTPIGYGQNGTENIISDGYHRLTFDVPEPKVFAYLTGSICPTHFPHDTPEAQKIVKPFDVFGKLSFSDRATGKLDLVRIITHQLVTLGVSTTNIFSDRLCTYETPWLASHRREPGSRLRNPVVVVLQ